MKRKALLLLFTATLAFAIPAHAADVLLFAFNGFDYQDTSLTTDPDPGIGYLAVGEGYKVVGFVTSVGPDLAPYTDFTPGSPYEYTYHAFNLTVAARFYSAGFLEVDFANNGRARYYRDLKASGGGTHGTYGINPPNATAPSTFTNGSIEVGGRIDNFVLTYDFIGNLGNFNGNMTTDEGNELTYVSVHGGWLLGGTAGRPNATVPTGYDNQVSGECRIPDVTPTTHKTWGAVKALYR